MKKTVNQIISVLVSVLFFIFLTATVLIFQTNVSLKSSYIQKSIERITITEIGKDGKVTSPIFSDTIDEIYAVASENNIPSEFVDTALNSEQVKNFFGKIIGNTIEQVVTGKAYDPVTKQELDQLIDDNVDQFVKESKKTVTEDEKETFVTLAKGYSQKIIDAIPTSDKIINQLNPRLIETVQNLTSESLKYIMLFITVVLGLFLLPLKWKQQKWMLFQAIPLLCSGILVILFGFLLPGISESLFYGEYSFILEFGSVIFSSISLSIILIGVGMVITSIIEFIVYKILKNRRDRKLDKKEK